MPLYIETCALCGLCKPIFSGTWQVDYNLILRYAAGNKQYKARKGVSPDTPSHIIQKHYEFYLANKIKSYRYMILFNLAYSVDVSFHCATLKVRSLRSQ